LLDILISAIVQAAYVIAKWLEGIALQQLLQSLLRASEIGIVPQPGFQWSSDPGLLRIDFPGVQVEHKRLLFFFKTLKRPFCELYGQKPEISATSRGQVGSTKFDSSGRKFQQLVSRGRCVNPRIAAGARNSVQIVVHREDA